MTVYNAGRIEAQLDVNRDPFYAALEEASQAGEAWSRHDWSAQVRADTTDATARLDEINAQIDRLSRERASLSVSADTGAARARLDELDARLEALGHEHATAVAELDDLNAQRKMRDLNTEMDAWGHRRDTATANVNTDQATSGFESLIGVAAGLAPALIPIAAAGTAAIGGMLPILGAAGAGFGALAAVAVPSLKHVMTGVQAITKVQSTYTAAIQDGVPAWQAAGQAMKGYNSALAAMTPFERNVATGVLLLKDQFQAIQKTNAPAVLGLFNRLLGLLGSQLHWITPIIQSMMGTLDRMTSHARTALSDPFWTRFFTFLATEAGPAIKTFGALFGGIFHMLAGVMLAFRPLMGPIERGLQHIGQALGSWGQHLGSTQGFADFMAYVHQVGPEVVDFLKTFGRSFIDLSKAAAPLGRVELPLITRALQLLDNILKIPGIGPIIVDIALLGFAASKVAKPIMQLTTTFKAMSSVVGLLSNPYLDLILILAAAGVAAYELYTHWNTVWAGMKRVFDQAVAWLRSGFGTLALIGLGPLGWFSILALHWQQLWRTMLSVFRAVSGALTGAWNATWGWVVNTAKAIWHSVSSFFLNMWHDVSTTVVRLAGDVVHWFSWLPDHIQHWVSKVPGIVAGAFSSAWAWATAWVGRLVGDVVGFFQGLPGKIGHWLDQIVTDMFHFGEHVVSAIVKGIEHAPKAIVNAIAGLLPAGGGVLKDVAGFLGLQAGGPVSAGVPYIVGEKGPELFVPGALPHYAQGGQFPAGSAGIVGEHGPELFVSGTAGTIIPNSALGSALANTRSYSAQTVQALHQGWNLVHAQSLASWQLQYQGLRTHHAQSLANTRLYGAQTVQAMHQHWGTVQTQSLATWSLLRQQLQSHHAQSMTNTMQYGALTQSFLHSTWTQVAQQSQGTWGEMTRNLTAANALMLGSTTNSVNAQRDRTLGAFRDVAGQLPGIVSGMWGNVESHYKFGINLTIGDLDSFLSGINQVGSQVGWAVNLHINGLAAGGTLASGAKVNKPTAIVGEGKRAYPEYVIPTDPQYRSNAMGLMAGWMKDTGIAKMAGGGVVPFAESFLGTPYVYGGTSAAGVDCSGLTYLIAQHFGIPNFPRTSEGQWAYGPRVPSSAAAPGDLAFFVSPAGGAPPGHVAVYLGGNMMLDAPHTGAVVRIEPMWGDLMGFTDPFGAAAANIPQWKALGAPSTLAGFPPAVANALAPKVAAFAAQKQKDYFASLAASYGAGGGGGPGSISPQAVASYWVQAGGLPAAASLMAQIAMAESGDQPGIVQKGQPYATTGWGLWQITPGNSVPSVGINQALLNPLANARAAVAKFNAAGGFQPWMGDRAVNAVGGVAAANAMVGLARGGVLGVYDQGGWLPQGLSLALNQTGQPERVVAPNAASGGDMTVHYSPTINIAPGTPEETRTMVRQELERHDEELMRKLYGEKPGGLWRG